MLRLFYTFSPNAMKKVIFILCRASENLKFSFQRFLNLLLSAVIDSLKLWIQYSLLAINKMKLGKSQTKLYLLNSKRTSNTKNNSHSNFSVISSFSL